MYSTNICKWKDVTHVYTCDYSFKHRNRRYFSVGGFLLIRRPTPPNLRGVKTINNIEISTKVRGSFFQTFSLVLFDFGPGHSNRYYSLHGKLSRPADTPCIIILRDACETSVTRTSVGFIEWCLTKHLLIILWLLLHKTNKKIFIIIHFPPFSLNTRVYIILCFYTDSVDESNVTIVFEHSTRQHCRS